MAWEPFDPDEWMKDMTRKELMDEINQKTQFYIEMSKNDYDEWSAAAQRAWGVVRFYNKLLTKIDNIAEKNWTDEKKLEKIKKLTGRVVKK